MRKTAGKVRREVKTKKKEEEKEEKRRRKKKRERTDKLVKRNEKNTHTKQS